MDKSREQWVNVCMLLFTSLFSLPTQGPVLTTAMPIFKVDLPISVNLGKKSLTGMLTV